MSWHTRSTLILPPSAAILSRFMLFPATKLEKSLHTIVNHLQMCYECFMASSFVKLIPSDAKGQEFLLLGI